MLASARYGDQEGNIYDPVRAFELNKKSAELSPCRIHRINWPINMPEVSVLSRI